MRGRALLAAALLLAAACGQEGTLFFELVLPPGLSMPADADRVRVALDNPAKEVIVPVADDGSFVVDFTVDAKGGSGTLLVEILDAQSDVLLRGYSPALPIAAFDAAFRIYVAPPGSVSPAPASLPGSRLDPAAANLPYGVLLAGGADAAGAPTRDLEILNFYDYRWQTGAELPAARAGLSAVSGDFGLVYLFGGTDDQGADSGRLWVFDTNVAPSGLYTELDDEPTLARAGAAAASLGGSRFLVTGDPPLLIDGAVGRIAPLSAAPPQARTATTATPVTTSAGVVVVLAGPDGVVRYSAAGNDFEVVTAPGAPRRDHAAVVVRPGEVLLVGGADPMTDAPLSDAVLVTAKAVETRPLLAQPRRAPLCGVVRGRLLVAGGLDDAGTPRADAEIFAAATLEPAGQATLPIPRAGGSVRPTPTGTLLVFGGATDTGGLPTESLEIFTP